MTKISIQPNASGSGTFTLTAPDSNDNRTFTLPDATGEVYTSGNILGTVSQSSGVPTGAIIERGSNANGEFVKYADGTLICANNNVITTANISPNAESANNTWNFPVSFVSTPSVSFYGKGDFSLTSNQRILISGDYIGFGEPSSLVIFSIANLGPFVTTVRVTGIAIGRWF